MSGSKNYPSVSQNKNPTRQDKKYTFTVTTKIDNFLSLSRGDGPSPWLLKKMSFSHPVDDASHFGFLAAFWIKNNNLE